MDPIKDSRGRSLTLRKMNALQNSRIVRLVGADDAMNQAYMTGFVLPSVLVSEIDGEPVSIPETRIQLEAAINRLDDAGISAVLDYLVSQSQTSDSAKDEVAQQKN